MSDSGSVVQTRQLAIQEADELDAAFVDEAGADERLAEDRVAPEGGGLGPEPGHLRARQLVGDVVDGDGERVRRRRGGLPEGTARDIRG